ncbi:hypothetical protein DXC78_05885 [Faecalicoccus pleomorphus]|uniref:Peptide O-xylosyltransferase n=1 Tax=Faecalicoccus pleomorphus TaxID=1323 RepID=A0A3E3E4N7_9FIRM|nr:beta-1,6-N-acetylglucosaminyltransferase [Faecalicoccus pleomorphus]RGD76560.1 hypothetical protein DXC78_05885 [Faecalicoccus pleomorphus]
MLKHAFIISVHKNFEQIKLLIGSLSFGDAFLHVDLKSDELYRKLCMEYKDSSNVKIIENRVSVNWSGFSQVEATLNLMKAVKNNHKEYDYIHFISGQDLLLLSPERLDNFIENHGKGKEFIDIEDIGNYKWRVRCFNFFRENPKNRTIILRGIDILLRLMQVPFIHRHNLQNYNLYKGSSWFSITSDFLTYVIKVVEETDYVQQFRYTACPDEHFFQILAMNSEFKHYIVSNNFRYVVFEKLNPSPKTLTMEDYSKFMNGNYMFARKFDLNENAQVVDEVINSLSIN